MKRFIVSLVALLSLCFLPSVSLGTGLETGFFTNVEYSSMSGDVGGYELYIALSRKGYTAVLLDCQGECSPLEKVVPTFEGSKISFEHIDLAGTKFIFKGEVDESGIRGSFHLPGEGIVEDVFLKRSKTYWNR